MASAATSSSSNSHSLAGASLAQVGQQQHIFPECNVNDATMVIPDATDAALDGLYSQFFDNKAGE